MPKRLFHVSEAGDISVSSPRRSQRADMDPSEKYVWAVDEKRLSNFLCSRDCPRVYFHKAESSSACDTQRFLQSGTDYVVAFESRWLNAVQSTRIYIYEFDSANFYLQDPIAGYYVSESEETPVRVTEIADPLAMLFERGVEVRFLPELFTLAEHVKVSTLNWSLCRMKFACRK